MYTHVYPTLGGIQGFSHNDIREHLICIDEPLYYLLVEGPLPICWPFRASCQLHPLSHSVLSFKYHNSSFYVNVYIISTSIYHTIHLYIHLSIHLSIYPSIHLYIHLCYMHIRLPHCTTLREQRSAARGYCKFPATQQTNKSGQRGIRESALPHCTGPQNTAPHAPPAAAASAPCGGLGGGWGATRRARGAARTALAHVRGNPSSNTTCLTHVFFESGESCIKFNLVKT